jgi:hypothetical protein
MSVVYCPKCLGGPYASTATICGRCASRGPWIGRNEREARLQANGLQIKHIRLTGGEHEARP